MERHTIKKRKKKRRRLKRILSVFLVVFLAITGYVVIQYYQGLKSAGESNITSKKNVEEFNGANIENTLGKVNVLLLGVDSRGEEQSRTDTIMIAQYDPENNTAKVVSVMRDIYAEIPGHKNYKINTAYFLGGPELLRKTLKENLDVDIHYYALVDFKGFEKVIDTLSPKGIEIEVEKDMSEYLDVELKKGIQYLDGKELLDYARFRNDAEGDFGRVRRQQQVINELKDQIISVNGIAKLPKLVGTVQPFIETNLSNLEIMGIMKDVLLNSPENIEMLRIPVEGSYKDAKYSGVGAVLEIDKKKNRQALDEFLNGTTSSNTVTETTDSSETKDNSDE